MRRQFWIAVACREHVQNGVAGGFCQVCHGKGAPLKKMRGGDLIAYYSSKERFLEETPCRRFTAVGQISEEPPFQFHMADAFIPWRRRVHFYQSEEAPIEPLIAKLTFIHDKVRWGFPFKRGCFTVPESDFRQIAEAMGAKLNERL